MDYEIKLLLNINELKQKQREEICISIRDTSVYNYKKIKKINI
jgi:hypothetical protein